MKCRQCFSFQMDIIRLSPLSSWLIHTVVFIDTVFSIQSTDSSAPLSRDAREVKFKMKVAKK